MVLSLMACADGRDRFLFGGYVADDGGRGDAGLDAGGHTPGVCKLSECPVPDTGVACCTPTAQCGMDTTGLGLNCVPLPGDTYASDRVCTLAECPTPTIGTACCTPFAQCGFDPFGTGLTCFAYPAPPPDAGTPQPACDLTTCPEPDGGGPAACCLANGQCGVDTLGIGICFAPAPPAPAPAPAPTPVTGPPDDPSITGECPSYLGAFGPVWGCCSDYGVCGTFQAGACLLPVGTQIPVSLPTDEDGGAGISYPLCTPPKK
jgi:hypothetical protein